jgi:hypothetical protein
LPALRPRRWIPRLHSLTWNPSRLGFRWASLSQFESVLTSISAEDGAPESGKVNPVPEDRLSHRHPPALLRRRMHDEEAQLVAGPNDGRYVDVDRSRRRHGSRGWVGQHYGALVRIAKRGGRLGSPLWLRRYSRNADAPRGACIGNSPGLRAEGSGIRDGPARLEPAHGHDFICGRRSSSEQGGRRRLVARPATRQERPEHRARHGQSPQPRHTHHVPPPVAARNPRGLCLETEECLAGTAKSLGPGGVLRCFACSHSY